MLIFQNIFRFQSTLPRRERRAGRKAGLYDLAFQSTLPRRERLPRTGLPDYGDYFNPRSREGSDSDNREMCSSCADFNPRSREGSDLLIDLPSKITVISIHAPAKGATLIGVKTHLFTGISIHAPAKGATFLSTSVLNKLIFQSTLPRRERLWSVVKAVREVLFQSTLPRRERRTCPCTRYSWQRISIHAPAKGATRTGTACPYCYLFQSTLPRRERPALF